MIDSAEIQFDGNEVTRRYLELDEESTKRQFAIYESLSTDLEKKEWLAKQGSAIVASLGAEIDRIEANIKKQRPEVKHIDLEIL